jgi:hypothetical protein
MAFGGIPQEAERMAHGNIITIERMFGTHLSTGRISSALQ